MGWSNSWIAVRGKPQETVLAELSQRRTGEHVELPNTETVTTILPSGWVFIWTDHFDEPLFLQPALAALSHGCELVSVKIEEHIMYSSAELWRNGMQVWFVSHYAERGLLDLTSAGDLPAFFADIKADYLRQQAKHHASNDPLKVDFIFDVPIETAARITGFRHDVGDSADKAAPYDVLEPAPPRPAGTPL
jgi:hypothetical protein